ncbi:MULTISPECIES: PP2C family protein-serine/threonine phosphatase [Streptomyces]|uniref:PP2C family protein-serine/threonine phosphatase n=1 Tax=Streptomyces TaxID=1883 RepID=UPI0009972785|nr:MULTISPECIES: PP2C family protein-serine/threonine phosphatase [Streptomyces]
MGQLRIALRVYATEGDTPATVMARASRFLTDLDTERSATCIYVDADVETRTLRLVRAGRLEPLVRHSTDLTGWASVRGGLPLGVATVFGQDGYPETRLDLNPVDTLLLCTDGMVKHPGRDIADGIEALAAAMRTGPRDTEALANHLCGGHPSRLGSSDDVGLLLLHRAAVPGTHATRQMTQHVHQADPEESAETQAMIRQDLAA